MAHYLPPNIMLHFVPRPPLEFKPPPEPHPMQSLSGVAEFVDRLKKYAVPPAPKGQTLDEKRAAKRDRRKKRHQKRLTAQRKKWDARTNMDATKDAYKTLFVARLDYSITEDDLVKEFSYYGPIKSVRLVKDRKNKPTGYAFVEFESSRDLTEAYKDADGRQLKNRRIVVDVERGRTVKNWLPRRLGGGLGGTRLGGKDVNTRYAGRDEIRSFSVDRTSVSSQERRHFYGGTDIGRSGSRDYRNDDFRSRRSRSRSPAISSRRRGDSRGRSLRSSIDRDRFDDRWRYSDRDRDRDHDRDRRPRYH